MLQKNIRGDLSFRKLLRNLATDLSLVTNKQNDFLNKSINVYGIMQ